MLVIARNLDDKIVISDRATGAIIGTVSVVDIKQATAHRGAKVRLGFDFPRQIGVDRSEVYEAKAAGRPVRDGRS